MMTTTRTSVWMFAAALLAAACGRSSDDGSAGALGPSSPPPRTFTLSGIVYGITAEGARQPVAGVRLARELHVPGGYSGGDSGWTTDAGGRYAIENIPSGSRVAVAAYTGAWYQPCAAVATMTDDVTLDIEIARTIPPRMTLANSPAVSGTVFRTGNDGVRRPSAGNQVFFTAQCRGLVLARTYADPAGRYTLCRLPAGAGCLEVNMSRIAWEYEGKQVAVDVQGDMALDLIADPD